MYNGLECEPEALLQPVFVGIVWWDGIYMLSVQNQGCSEVTQYNMGKFCQEQLRFTVHLISN